MINFIGENRLQVLPWLFFGSGTQRDCQAHILAFKREDVIPTQCRYFCWKVVVPLESLGQLLRFKQYLKKQAYLSKCGIDFRDYTEEDYVAFIYCDSHEEAKAISEKLVHPSRVSRGCTEMRLKFPVELWGETDLIQENKEVFYIFQSLKTRKDIVRNWFNY